MVESAIDQCLAKIRSDLADTRRPTRGQIRFANSDGRQVAHIRPSQIGRCVGGAGVTSPDVQGSREGVIPHVWCIVAGAAGSLQRVDASGNQATGRHIVVYARYTGDIDGLGIENGLTTSNRRPRGRIRQCRPGVEGVEDCGSELAVTRRHKPTRSFKCGDQRVDAGVDTEKERLSSESYGSAIRSLRVQSAGVVADGLRGEKCHLKIDNLLLLCRRWSRAVTLRVVDGGVDRLVRKIVQKRSRIVREKDLGCAGGRR